MTGDVASFEKAGAKHRRMQGIGELQLFMMYYRETVAKRLGLKSFAIILFSFFYLFFIHMSNLTHKRVWQ